MDEGAVLVTVSGSRHKIKREEESNMLIIDGNSVYEIDEECVRKKKVPKECGIYEMQQQNLEKDREYAARDHTTKRP